MSVGSFEPRRGEAPALGSGTEVPSLDELISADPSRPGVLARLSRLGEEVDSVSMSSRRDRSSSSSIRRCSAEVMFRIARWIESRDGAFIGVRPSFFSKALSFNSAMARSSSSSASVTLWVRCRMRVWFSSCSGPNCRILTIRATCGSVFAFRCREISSAFALAMVQPQHVPDYADHQHLLRSSEPSSVFAAFSSSLARCVICVKASRRESASSFKRGRSPIDHSSASCCSRSSSCPVAAGSLAG